ncbi:hypothetical protein TNCV_4596841 [Trichonephila clavipes]|uniref:Uncharacterized protein n=1 Tax=Trichonephila clavipes TaxID=2585209 RepID=A0A8X7BJD9_TRICX|nr:hypothetical protein TNCV_4596841 [Trichonephila clavipes]
MLTITVQHMSYEVQLQLYQPLVVGEESLSDSNLVLAENERGVSDFRSTLYKRSGDFHLSDEQQLLYLTRVYQPQRSRYFLSGLGYVQLFVYQHHSGDVKRTCFTKFTMKNSVIRYSSNSELHGMHS